MRLTALPNRALLYLRQRTRLGEWGATAWHRWMPAWPVSKRFYGLKVCLNLRDGLLWLATNADDVERNDRFTEMLAGVKGAVWDVGCNVGIFSLLAASKGFKTLAFDISPVAIKLVERSAQANNLRLEIVCRAFAATSYSYAPPRDADTRNAPGQATASDSVMSMTFGEAQAQFGLPAFIKVDIEHHEVALLESTAFRDWIKANHISLLVEIHSPDYMKLLWPEVEHVMFDSVHVLFNPTPEHKAAIAARAKNSQ